MAEGSLFDFLRRTRHQHSGIAVGVTHYGSITGPRTIPQYRCDCGHVWTGQTLRGEWTLGQLNGEAVS